MREETLWGRRRGALVGFREAAMLEPGLKGWLKVIESIFLDVFRMKVGGGLPGGSVVKNPPANSGDARDADPIPGVGKITWRRKWQPTPVLLPEKFHRWRSLVGYSPRDCKQSDTTEQLHFTSPFSQMIQRSSNALMLITASAYLLFLSN